MKHSLIAIAVLFCAGFSIPVFAAETQTASQQEKIDFSNAKITLKTNKSALSYLPGEEMVFTFTLDMGNSSKPSGLFLQYTCRDDEGKRFSGQAPADQPLIVKTSLSKPGFVNVVVKLINENGSNFIFEHPLANGNKAKKTFQYHAGTAVQPEKLTDCGEPADFDQFWADQKKRLAEVPFLETAERKLVCEGKIGRVYALSIPAPGGRPSTGYVSIPYDAKEKSLPIYVVYHGYGHTIHPMPKDAMKGIISASFNAHGQELGREPEYYKKFFASLGSNGYSYAFDPNSNHDRETLFFNGMTLRNLRGLEYLKTLPEWNGKMLVVSGSSQGGLQTMLSAALDPDVTHANPGITWCCDIAGKEKKNRICGGWRIKYTPALDYYDPVFHAKRIKHAKVNIVRAGLGDYVCPPSGLAISYNNLATPHKTIRWCQGSTHGFTPNGEEVIIWSTEK